MCVNLNIQLIMFRFEKEIDDIMHDSNYERYMLAYIHMFCAKIQKVQHHMAPTEDLNHFKMTFVL